MYKVAFILQVVSAISFLEYYSFLYRRYKQFGECVAPFKTSCNSTLSLIFESFDSGLGYLCEKEHLDGRTRHHVMVMILHACLDLRTVNSFLD